MGRAPSEVRANFPLLPASQEACAVSLGKSAFLCVLTFHSRLGGDDEVMGVGGLSALSLSSHELVRFLRQEYEMHAIQCSWRTRSVHDRGLC